MNMTIYPVLVSLVCGGWMLAVKHLRFRGSCTAAWLFWTAAQAALLVSLASRLREGGALVLHTGGWAQPLGISLVFDGTALFGSLLVLITGSAALLSALGDRSIPAAFHLFVYFFLAACQGILVARDMFTLFVFFEIIAIAAYILIAAKRYPRAVLAGFRYLLIASVTIFFYLAAVFIVYRATGSLAIPGTQEAAAMSGAERALAAAAILAGLTSRMAVVPFHGWLPEAHSQAAHPVSALLSGLLIKIPLLLLFRFAPLLSAPFLPGAEPVILYSGAATALFGAFMALVQRDAKRLLAYSSISQMGFMFAGFGAGPPAAAAVMLHALNHALFKPLLFLSAGAAADRAGSRDLEPPREASAGPGIWSLFYLVGAASLAGIPLSGGYLSKHLLSASLYGAGAVPALLTVSAAFTAAYCVKLGGLFLPNTGPAGKTKPAEPAAGISAAAILALLALAAGALPFAAGVLPFPASAFKAPYLLKQLLTMGAGALLWALFRRRPARDLARRIRMLPLGTEASMTAMLTGFLLSFAVLL